MNLCLLKSKNLLYIVAAFLLLSCSSNPPNSTYQSQPSQSVSSPPACLNSYYSVPPATICTAYFSSGYSPCDRDMREEMTRRGLKLSPRDECGQPIVQANKCDIRTFASQNGAMLCETFWSGLNKQCESSIASEMTKRSLALYPRRLCGVLMNDRNSSMGILKTCTPNELKSVASNNLCADYHHGTNICTSDISDELISRGLIVFPEQNCGKNLTSVISDIPKVRDINNDSEVQGSCLSLLNKISKSANAIVTACAFRYKNISEESILCRKNIIQYIHQQSKGVGSSFASCGK